MPIQRARPLRVLAVQARSRAVDEADRAAAALASIEAEIAAALREVARLDEEDRRPAPASGRAALFEADALERCSRRARSRSLAAQLERLESEREAARRDLDAAKEALAKAIRAVEKLSTKGS